MAINNSSLYGMSTEPAPAPKKPSRVAKYEDAELNSVMPYGNFIPQLPGWLDRTLSSVGSGGMQMAADLASLNPYLGDKMSDAVSQFRNAGANPDAQIEKQTTPRQEYNRTMANIREFGPDSVTEMQQMSSPRDAYAFQDKYIDRAKMPIRSGLVTAINPEPLIRYAAGQQVTPDERSAGFQGAINLASVPAFVKDAAGLVKGGYEAIQGARAAKQASKVMPSLLQAYPKMADDALTELNLANSRSKVAAQAAKPFYNTMKDAELGRAGSPILTPKAKPVPDILPTKQAMPPEAPQSPVSPQNVTKAPDDLGISTEAPVQAPVNQPVPKAKAPSRRKFLDSLPQEDMEPLLAKSLLGLHESANPNQDLKLIKGLISRLPSEELKQEYSRLLKLYQRD